MQKRFYLFFLFTNFFWAQHAIKINAELNEVEKTIAISQEILFNNYTNEPIKTIVLNDWSNAYSSKNSALARRFSDEFSRIFHLASEKERGYTKILHITDSLNQRITWERPENQVDLIHLHLNEPILAHSKKTIKLRYIVKIPHEKFSKYGYFDNGKFYLKYWYLCPATVENKKFIENSNENIDDIANASSNYELKVTPNENFQIITDLLPVQENSTFIGTNKQEVILIFEPKNKIEFKSFKNEFTNVFSSIKDNRISELQMAITIDKITRFIHNDLQLKPIEKIIVSQEDYNKNPFYGINQLPSFINPFPDEFIFEIKFLKTYLNNLLKESLQINPRKDHWILEGIQQFYLMKYIDLVHQDCKMLGNLSRFKILKGYTFSSIDFNDQFYHLYMLMARKNLDQALSLPKNQLIKFNEQISGKYKAGLSLRYLDSYLSNEIVAQSLLEFLELNQNNLTNTNDLKEILSSNTSENLDWFFEKLIDSRDIIDFKIINAKKTEENIIYTVRNLSNTKVPIPIYGLNDKDIVYKQWLFPNSKDTTLTIPRNKIEKLVLNYHNEVPEFNQRNNWKSLKSLSFNRPLKFTFFKDFENSYYNQIFYVPILEYNLYDGVSMGMKFNNVSLINKPFVFDANPTYSTNTGKLIGSFSTQINQYIREGKLYNIRYNFSTSVSHYAPDSKYTRIIPSVSFRFRDLNLRTNKNEYITLAQYYVNREKTDFITDKNTQNYNVFNAKYFNIQSEMTKHFSLFTDLQVADSFGKVSGEIQYRKLFEDNRRINLRFFAGRFLYKDVSSDFFSFGIDRPTDYLFNYNLLGRSESTGLFSQQYVQAEGGFKSKFKTRYANQWMSSINASFNIWNWIEVYGDAGIVKSKGTKAEYLYDSGIRLNLVPDYFELYFPVYSSNGYELGQDNYNEKIRFVITLSPKTLISLFTRKWF